MNQSKKIILFIAAIFILSSVFLFAVSEKKMDPDYKKDWWVVYFDEPENSKLNFTIENHSDEDNFHWELISDSDKISEGDAKIAKGSAWTSNVQVDNLSGKVIVRVSSGSDKKEIHKSFSK